MSVLCMLAASKTLRWKNRRFVGLFNFSSKNFRQLTYFLASILFYILSGQVPIPVREMSSYLCIMKTRVVNDKEPSSNPQPSTICMQTMLVPHGMVLGAWESCQDSVLCTPSLILMKRGSVV